jgi:hypothetical protein
LGTGTVGMAAGDLSLFQVQDCDNVISEKNYQPINIVIYTYKETT